MVTRLEVYRACDKLRAAGKRVTLRAVVKGLEDGGSFRDVGPELRLWKRERDYRPRLELADMPKEVKTKFEAFSVAAWKAVRERAGVDLGRAMAEKAEIDEELLEEIDKRDARLKAMEATLKAMEREAAAHRDAARAQKSAAEALAHQVRALQEELSRLSDASGNASARPDTALTSEGSTHG